MAVGHISEAGDRITLGEKYEESGGEKRWKLFLSSWNSLQEAQ